MFSWMPTSQVRDYRSEEPGSGMRAAIDRGVDGILFA
jgi:hypothetical protein